MDISAPNPALINSPNINSVLKPPKPRVPLKDLMAAAPEEDNTAVRKRRVSFANVNKIKEFSAVAESMVVCQTPAYEEPFSVSSDSSYPSGVDGWTPGKGQSTIGLYVQPPYYPEKENLSIPTLRMSAEMDLTSIVGNPAYSTRYSVNGMDLTEVANSCQSANNQQTRFSLGMDLTDVAIGHSFHSTRYSVSGMDLTSGMAQSHNALFDQRNSLSMAMDFTGTIGHSKQNTRYSINGMDLTEAANLHQTLPDQRNARFSDGMDFTNVVGNPMSTMRYSCNEMDLTEAAKPFSHNEQSCETDILVNTSMNDSVALELTETVKDNIQFTPVSPKHKINDVVLKENVLYSVNNTRYSVSNMNLTSAIGSHMSTTRRKSSRYSLVNMDLTEVIDNSSDDLEFTQTIGDPSIKVGTTRNSVCEMDLTESVDEISNGVSLGCTNQTSVGDNLKYSTNSESFMNLTKPNSININPSSFGKEHVLPNHSVKIVDIPSVLSSEDPTHVDDKCNNLSMLSTTACDDFPAFATINLVANKPGQGLPQDTLPLSTGIRDESLPIADCGADKLKKGSLGSDINESLVAKPNLTPSIEQAEFVGKNLSCFDSYKSVLEMTEKPDGEVDKNNIKLLVLDGISNSVEQIQGSNFEEECKQNENIRMNSFDLSPSKKDGVIEEQVSSYLPHTKNLTFDTESNNQDSICKEIMIAADDDINISITDSTGLEKLNSPTTKQACSFEEKKPEQIFPERECSLDESIMNMSLENTSIDQVQDVENRLNKNSDAVVQDICSVPVLNIDHKDNQQLNFTTSKDQPTEFKMSPNSSLNLSHSRVICNKNITMTRGRSKSLIIMPNTSLDITNTDQMVAEDTVPTTSIELQTNTNCKIYTPEINSKHGISSRQSKGGNGSSGKRSFEAALEPENDTEESPVKQLCVSREEHSTEYDILNNVTVPSFLMDTVSASNETDKCFDQHETISVSQEETDSKTDFPSKSNFKNLSPTFSPQSICKAKQDFSLRIDGSFTCNMSENPLRQEVIDLCESSLDATTTEVRDLINNSRYKSTNLTNIYEVVTKHLGNLNHIVRKCDSSGFYELQDQHFDQTVQVDVIKEEHSTNNFNMDEPFKTDNLEKELEISTLESLHFPVDMQSVMYLRKQKRLRIVGKNAFTTSLIPNWIEISYTIDSLGNVVNVDYQNIATGGHAAIGEYLLKQARNLAFPKKGSDLIVHLQSANKSYLARLARNLNIICKYHNGKIKGDILTLEITSCANHFWTFIDINIKHPQSLNQTDITISEQKIGEVKLSFVRKVFNCIETNEDQLLKFAKAMTKVQHNNFTF